MKIENFNPGQIQISNSLYFFNGCKIEIFEGEGMFIIDGNIEIAFTENEIDISYINILFTKDPEGKNCSLSNKLKREVEKEIEDLLESLIIETC